MVFGSVGFRRVRFRALVGLIGVVAVAASIAASPAEAARKKKRPAGGGYAPPYAAMVVDARTGRTLHAVNEDAARIPASITKVMTLYLLFEQLERGKFNMNSELTVSANAARESPSKIGFRPGETISVRDAILAVITKSANDVATAIGENIAGSEDEFARMMTARARSLGMSRSTFYNAHGLPHNPPNITTARDLTILARAIQERFPRYYPMFSTRVFNFAGGAYRNHNKLLGRVEGVDGIKTGYTNLSGFNLMTSAKSEGRHIVSVVLGGRSGGSRDKIMADLVASTLPRAATSGRATMVAEAPQDEPPARAVPAPPPRQVVAAAPEPAPLPVPRPRVQQQEQAVPAAARAYTAMATTTTPIAPPRPINVGAPPLQISNMRAVTATTTPSAMRWSIGAPAADGKVLRPPANVDVTSSIAKVSEPEQQPAAPKLAEAKAPEHKPEQRKIELRQPEVAPAIAEKKHEGGVTALAKAAPESRASDARPGPVVASGKWIIQLGATDDEAKAKDILARARSKASGPLADAAAFTEKVERGGTTLFRARFAGFDDSKDANNACAKLKRDGFACFATRG